MMDRAVAGAIGFVSMRDERRAALAGNGCFNGMKD
jgi:hypothetical protein